MWPVTIVVSCKFAAGRQLAASLLASASLIRAGGKIFVYKHLEGWFVGLCLLGEKKD